MLDWLGYLELLPNLAGRGGQRRRRTIRVVFPRVQEPFLGGGSGSVVEGRTGMGSHANLRDGLLREVLIIAGLDSIKT